MMETGRMTIVVALVHTVYLRGLDTERFTLEDGKMTKDTYVSMSFTQYKELFFLCFQYITYKRSSFFCKEEFLNM